MRAAYVTRTLSPTETEFLSADAEKTGEKKDDDFSEGEESCVAATPPAAPAGWPSSPFEENAPIPDVASKVASHNAALREGAKAILLIAPPPCASLAP
jgi:hypothetical protein